jgi:hypothetical protein
MNHIYYEYFYLILLDIEGNMIKQAFKDVERPL